MAGVVVAAGEVLHNVHGTRQDVLAIRHLMNSFEYRTWGSRIAVAADLVCRGLASYRGAAMAARVSTPRMQRAVAALHDGRDVCANGRPHLLPSEQRDELHNRIRSRLNNKDRLTIHVICIELCICNLWSPHGASLCDGASART